MAGNDNKLANAALDHGFGHMPYHGGVIDLGKKLVLVPHAPRHAGGEKHPANGNPVRPPLLDHAAR